MTMVLRVTAEEIEMMQAALSRERKQILRDIAECHHLGHSPAAITLCHRRAAIDQLLDHLLNPPEDLTVVRAEPVVEPIAVRTRAA
jgi:hypothetical protein